MRIRFGTWIHECKFVSNPGYGNMINAATSNGLYTITFDTEEKAHLVYEIILKKGYYDATNDKYQNF